jgi:hypothetical protein
MNPPEPELRIRFTKRADGVVIVHCTRRDNSVTWQRHDKHGVFFSFHDLIHFVVETTLGFSHGFFGLLADGWDIVDTTGDGPRGKPPIDAMFVEHIVGLFAGERSGGAEPLPAAEFNALIEQMTGLRLPHQFTDSELNATRSRIDALHQQWAAVAAGSSMELIFDRSTNATSAR